MKYVKSYYVNPSGSGRITTHERATPFAVARDGINLRVFMAVDDERPTEPRDVYVLEDMQPFEPKGPVKYLGTVLMPGAGAAEDYFVHVLIDDPKPKQGQGIPQVQMSELPPDVQEQIRRQLEGQQAQPGQDSPSGG